MYRTFERVPTFDLVDIPSRTNKGLKVPSDNNGLQVTELLVTKHIK